MTKRKASKVIKVTVTEEEDVAISGAARNVGLPAATWLRTTALSTIRKEEIRAIEAVIRKPR